MIHGFVVIVSRQRLHQLLPEGQGHRLEAVTALPGLSEIGVVVALAPAQPVALKGEGHPRHQDEVEAAVLQV